MTPQERQLVTDLFGRLASLENNPRDAEAERLIIDGLRRAPNGVYALVQTVLLQDEALRRANERIQELEGHAPGEAQNDGGFLGQMRDTFFGGRSGGGSVPSAGSRWGQPQQNFQNAQMQPQAQPGIGGGGSFLGTAAAAAAGVIGGSILMNSLGSMFGNRSSGQAFASEDAARAGGSSGGSPWGNNADSDLARDAGLNDIGRGQRNAYNDSNAQPAGLFDDGGNNDAGFDNDFDGGDFGGDGGGDSA